MPGLSCYDREAKYFNRLFGKIRTLRYASNKPGCFWSYSGIYHDKAEDPKVPFCRVFIVEYQVTINQIVLVIFGYVPGCPQSIVIQWTPRFKSTP